ncbi:hypothetical protein N658DRAFT_57879 [Parathielavia hyrcaniae]|uniref:Uncharacterized protein n=1 Tax=Parathielavia hyrcaniae TaxID=113614 RepID=A0AAN6Q5H4_9PEZI|nr:hypothetical protein N658DRAFT_57879 [Parathielavia hyrcaniae]
MDHHRKKRVFFAAAAAAVIQVYLSNREPSSTPSSKSSPKEARKLAMASQAVNEQRSSKDLVRTWLDSIPDHDDDDDESGNDSAIHAPPFSPTMLTVGHKRRFRVETDPGQEAAYSSSKRPAKRSRREEERDSVVIANAIWDGAAVLAASAGKLRGEDAVSAAVVDVRELFVGELSTAELRHCTDRLVENSMRAVMWNVLTAQSGDEEGVRSKVEEDLAGLKSAGWHVILTEGGRSWLQASWSAGFACGGWVNIYIYPF